MMSQLKKMRRQQKRSMKMETPSKEEWWKAKLQDPKEASKWRRAAPTR